MANFRQEQLGYYGMQSAYIDLSAGAEVVMQFSNSRPTRKDKLVTKDYCVYRAGWPLFRRLVGQAVYSQTEPIYVPDVDVKTEDLTIGHIALRWNHGNPESYDKGIFYIAKSSEHGCEPYLDLHGGRVISPTSSEGSTLPYIQAVESDIATAPQRYQAFRERLTLAAEAMGMFLPQLTSEYMKGMDRS